MGEGRVDVPREPEDRQKSPFGQSLADLRALNLATMVAESGSIRLAAQRAHMSASAVSRHIRSLEDRLGVSLFERRSTGVRPTEAGVKLLATGRRLLHELKAAASQARDAGTAEIGRLVIGTYFSTSAGRLRAALQLFMYRHRRVQLVMMEGSRQYLLQAIREGRADLAILLGPREERGLDSFTLWTEAGMVALPEEHRLAHHPLVKWQDLASETFIVRRRGSGAEVRARVEALLPPDQAANFVEHSVSRDGMFNLVGAGIGLAVLAESATGAAYPGVVFRPVGTDLGPTTVEATAYWDPKRDNPALRRFLVLLRAAHRVEPSEGSGS